MSKSLTIIERSEYNTLKKEIRKWAEDRFLIGAKLLRIRDGKLYRDDHGTFEECCELEFGFKRAHAYRLMDAQEVKSSLGMSPMGDKITNERQTRALADVPPEKRAQVVEAAAKKGPVTAKSITAAAKNGAKDAELVVRDDTGYIVPPRALPFWERKGEAEQLARLISAARSAIRDIPKDDTMFAEVKVQSVVADLGNAYREFKQAIPHAVCPVCQGQTPKSCTLCKGRGVISKFKFDTAVPEELKKIRAKSCKK